MNRVLGLRPSHISREQNNRRYQYLFHHDRLPFYFWFRIV
jgi:hypothetical protein